MSMNMDLLSKVLIFGVGAAIGSVVTWKLVKDKYKKIADEEIESVKDHYYKKQLDDLKSKGEKLANDIQKTIEKNKNTDKDTCNNIIERFNYADTSDDINEEEVDDVEKPYVIEPEEYGDLYDYEQVSLTYYADGVLTDEIGNVVENIDDVVGRDFASHFGEYEDDSVFIRNDVTKCDYEILRVEEKFSDL